MNNQRNNISKTIGTIVLSILSFALGIYIKSLDSPKILGISHDIAWIMPVISALLIPLYAIQITLHQNILQEINQTNSSLVDILNQCTLRYAGTANEAAEAVAQKMKTASAVLNTYIISEHPYNSEVGKKVENAYFEFITKGNTLLEEITSTEGSKRTQRIVEKLNGKLPSSYKPRVIKEEFKNVPLCNFIIMRHSQNREEIYFGWGYFKHASNESVFWSDDEKLIAFFKGYHREMRKDEVSRDFIPPTSQKTIAENQPSSPTKQA